MAFDIDAFLAKRSGAPASTGLAGPNWKPPTPEGDDVNPSVLESSARGAAQGVTFGFADEISGALRSAFSDRTYKELRDESRSSFKRAQEANPFAYGLSEVLGGVATGVVTGGVAGAAAKLGTAGIAGLAAAEGAVAGLGSSEATDVGGQLKDVATGGVVGGVLGAGVGKLVGKFAATAEARSAKHIAQDITEGSNMTNKKRFAQVQHLAGDFFERPENRPLRAAMSDPQKASELVQGRLSTLVETRKPQYDTVDKALPFRVGQVEDRMTREIAKAQRDPGAETWATLLTRTRDNFVRAATMDSPDVATSQVVVPAIAVRRWVTNLLSEADHTIGSLAETERYHIKDRLHKVADEILKDHLDAAASKGSGVKSAVDKLRDTNRDIAVLMKTQDALKPRLDKELVGHQSLMQIIKGNPLTSITTGAVLGGYGGAIMGAAPAVAGSVGKTLNRTATTAYARLARGVREGGDVSALRRGALEAGVPVGLVNAITGTARVSSSEVEE